MSEQNGQVKNSETQKESAQRKDFRDGKSGRMRRRFQNARKLDSAVDFVQAATADQQLPLGPRPPARLGACTNVVGFSENFVTSVFSQAIVNTQEEDLPGKVDDNVDSTAQIKIHRK